MIACAHVIVPCECEVLDAWIGHRKGQGRLRPFQLFGVLVAGRDFGAGNRGFIEQGDPHIVVIAFPFRTVAEAHIVFSRCFEIDGQVGVNPAGRVFIGVRNPSVGADIQAVGVIADSALAPVPMVGVILDLGELPVRSTGFKIAGIRQADSSLRICHACARNQSGQKRP